jgi:hypothetical protein
MNWGDEALILLGGVAECNGCCACILFANRPTFCLQFGRKWEYLVAAMSQSNSVSE